MYLVSLKIAEHVVCRGDRPKRDSLEYPEIGYAFLAGI